MVFNGYDFLDENEIDFINQLLINFKEDEVPGYKKNEYRRDYYRQEVKLLESIEDKILKIIKEISGRDTVIAATWVNRVDSESNNDDDYHKDDTNASFVYYPNNDFAGGELEYIINDEVITTQIRSNSYVILTNKVKHRVKPVLSGVRWSVAAFCAFKQIKSNLI